MATSAVRDAENGQQFLDAATEVIRAQAEVLSGSEEGRLSYAGATMGLAPSGGDDVVVDIGGGSTELVVDVDGLVAAVSLDIGCVRVTERYLTDDPPEPDQVGAATEGITEALRTAGERIPRLRSLREPRRLIGLAGTVSTLAMLELGMADYERDLVHHAELSAASVERWSSGLLRESVRERLSHPGLPEGRADVIAAGALILHLAMSELSFESCLVSESDILDGLVASIRSCATGQTWCDLARCHGEDEARLLHVGDDVDQNVCLQRGEDAEFSSRAEGAKECIRERIGPIGRRVHVRYRRLRTATREQCQVAGGRIPCQAHGDGSQVPEHGYGVRRYANLPSDLERVDATRSDRTST